jgi:hypothetical protein
VNGKASLGLVQLESAVCSGEGAVVVYLKGGYRCECSEFDYGDLKEHIMEDNDEDDDEDDLEESDFGAEDGEGAADNEDDNYGDY